jgi:hypothetical protein
MNLFMLSQVVMYCRSEAGCVGWRFLGCISVLSGYYLEGLDLYSVRLLK